MFADLFEEERCQDGFDSSEIKKTSNFCQMANLKIVTRRKEQMLNCVTFYAIISAGDKTKAKTKTNAFAEVQKTVNHTQQLDIW